MEFRIEKTALLLALAAPLAAAELRYNVRHDHWRKGGDGVLVFTEQSVSFEEPKKPKHKWRWAYGEIQKLEVAPKRLRLLTYEDSRWRLGADREHEFVSRTDDFAALNRLLKDRLDQRLIAALSDADVGAAWEIPAKLTGRFGGAGGVLKFGEDRVVFETEKPAQSRTWRWTDIDNISSSGPFDLTIVSFERARTHFGNRKGFNFQLKAPLAGERYDGLWRRLNHSQGLKHLN